MNNFFSVSLPDNILSIQKTLFNLSCSYDNFKYTIVCPRQALPQFHRLRATFGQSVSLIDEDKLLTFAEFAHIVDQVKNVLLQNNVHTLTPSNRYGWYYQQCLKLGFMLSSAQNAEITLLDGDTIFLNKIIHFENARSKIYFTPYEKHLPYWKTLSSIFNQTVTYEEWKSTTCQISSITPAEAKHLIAELNKYLEKYDHESIYQWISKIVISAVLQTHQSITGANISEQDLIGYFLQSFYQIKPEPLFFLRPQLTNYLSNEQENFLEFIGCKHITYEKSLFRNHYSSKAWGDLINILLHLMDKSQLKHQFSEFFSL